MAKTLVHGKSEFNVLAECGRRVDGTLGFGNRRFSLLHGRLTFELVRSERYGLQLVISLWNGELVKEFRSATNHNRIEICVPMPEAKRMLEEALLKLYGVKS